MIKRFFFVSPNLIMCWKIDLIKIECDSVTIAQGKKIKKTVDNLSGDLVITSKYNI